MIHNKRAWPSQRGFIDHEGTMTKRHGWILATIVVLVLGAWGLRYAMADKGPAADILMLADLIAGNDDAALKDQAEVVSRKHKTIGPLMRLFKKRTTEGGGLGVGKVVGIIQPDGIEAKILALAKNGPNASELEQHGDDLVRMTQVLAAVAEVAKHKCEVNRKVGFLNPTDWKHWLEGMQQSSRDMAEAVRANDGARVKSTAASLGSHCTKCHRIFRE
jgi:hypothetical protein